MLVTILALVNKEKEMRGGRSWPTGGAGAKSEQITMREVIGCGSKHRRY